MVTQLITNKTLGWIEHQFGEAMSEDIRLFMGDKFKIKHLFNRKTLSHPLSEFTLQKKQWRTLLKKDRVHTRILKPTFYGPLDARVIMINGVMSPFNIATHQSEVLSQCIGAPVSLIYNPTIGLIKDLLECHQDRHGEPTDIVRFTMERITLLLLQDGPVVIVGYSQGAIIASAAIAQLAKLKSASELSRIHYVTLGAGFKESILPHYIKQEHFANANDPVTHMGLLSEQYTSTGKAHIRDAHGHLMVADYLLPIKAGEFGGDSLFETYFLPDEAQPI
jgi:hypothetical protein